MGAMSLWHWLVLGAIVLLLFGGRGKISDIMGDVAKGIKSFKKGLAEDEPQQSAPAVEAPEESARVIEHQAVEAQAPKAKAAAKPRAKVATAKSSTTKTSTASKSRKKTTS